MKRIFLVLALLLSGGCTSLSYTEPAEGPRARVRFATTTSAITVLRVYDDANCTQNETEWMRLRAGVLMNSSPKKLGLPLWNFHENAAKEVYVRANKDVHGMFFGSQSMGTTTYSCGVPFSYNFLDNSDYEVKFIWGPSRCLVSISQITGAGSDASLKLVAMQDNRVTDSNRGCMDQFKKQRLY